MKKIFCLLSLLGFLGFSANLGWSYSVPDTRQSKGYVSAAPKEADQESTLKAYGKLPLYFIENKGQLDSKVRFYVKTSGQTLYFTDEGIVFDLLRVEKEAGKSTESTEKGIEATGKKTERLVFNLSFENAQNGFLIEGLDRQDAGINYFVGNDRSKWKAGIPTYKGVVYQGVYKGIDLKVFGNGKDIEYEFIVNPGGTPEDRLLTYNGIEGLTTSGEGELLIATAFGELKETRPYIYQEIDGKRAVDGSFEIQGAADQSQTRSFSYGFQVAAYDPSYPLIIDPTLSYSTYLGGSGGEVGYGIAVDGLGNAYVTGYTSSSNFPTQAPYQGTYAGGWDAFITKLSPSGNTLSYSTYLGGSGYDFGYGIAVDGSGNAYVTGRTESTDFPMQNPYQGTNAGTSDAFITKLSPSGSALSYSTYLGGAEVDYAYGITVDGSGNVYVTGDSESTDFPTQNPYQGTNAGTYDAFITKLSSSGSTLSYSTYLGGSSYEYGCGIAVDGSGNAYVTGGTSSSNFPTENPYQGTNAGTSDAFITKLSSSGSALFYSTYLGGNTDDRGNGIAVDGSGNAYVTGTTVSINFPTQNPYQGTNAGGGYDAFITKLSSSGSALSYSTYLGGSGYDFGNGIAVDGSGNAYVTGRTKSTDFPTENPYQGAFAGGTDDAFITKLSSSGSTLSYSTYLGGSSYEYGCGIAVDGSGNAYVTGGTDSSNFPMQNPYQGTNAGSRDAFVAKLVSDTTSPTVTTTAASSITSTSASSGGNVTSDGGAAVTARGVCWSTSTNPTISGSKTSDGTGTGSFTSSITGLTPGTTYHVRAYATNGAGTSYGSDLMFTTSAQAQGTGYAYIANQSNNTLTVLDTDNNQVVTIVPVGVNPQGVAVTMGGEWVYVANMDSNNVSVIKTSDYSVTNVAVGNAPVGVAVNPAGTRVYVSNMGSASVSVIDTTNNNSVTTIAVGGTPWGVAVNPAGTSVYVANYGLNNVNVIDTTNNNSVTSMGAGNDPIGVVVNPILPQVYVVYRNSYSIGVIDTNNYNNVIPVIFGGLAGPYGVAVNPDGTRVYVTNAGNDSVHVIDITNNYSVQTIPSVGGGAGAAFSSPKPIGISVNLDGTRVYVANWGTDYASNNVAVIETSGNTVINRLTMGTSRYSLGQFIGPAATAAATTPTVTTTAASSITQNSASSGGNVTSDGGVSVIARGVCWSTSENPTISDTHTTDGTGTGSFASSITGLNPGTAYHVRAYATNSAGISYGADLTFTTSTTAPIVSTTAVSSITTSSAESGGNITSDGGDSVAARGVCWSTSANPTISGNHTSNGIGIGSFASNIIGLSPESTYHVRAYATNSAGTGYGDDLTFTTTVAILVTFNFSGTVTEVTDSAIFGGLVVGDKISGSYTFDSTTSPEGSLAYWYVFPNEPSTQLNVKAGTLSLTQPFKIGVYDDAVVGLVQDLYAVNSGDEVSAEAIHVNMEVEGHAPDYITSLDLPITPPLVTGPQIIRANIQLLLDDNINDEHGSLRASWDILDTTPAVTTTAVSSITHTSAISGGNVTSGGGVAVTARGVCWSTTAGPTINDSHTSDGTGTGNFTSSITGLNPGTTYHVRAYATNSAGTAYGPNVTFTTLNLGALTVNLAPQGAVGAGAKWNIDGGDWQDSGVTLSDLEDGEHTIYFKDVAGWIPPAMRTVTIIAGETTEISLVYTQETGRVPDTGQTKCYDNDSEIPCPRVGGDFHGQDGTYLINAPLYTKLDASGNDLPDTATSWVMVRDNVTGLIWEVKTDDGSVHDKDNTYTWYDSNPTTNGGDPGTPGDGTDTEDFISALNTSQFGGLSDWRLPTIQEMTAIVDLGREFPTIDTAYFPNTVSNCYWSSTTYVDDVGRAWEICIGIGYSQNGSKNGGERVRAVHGGTAGSLDSLVINGDGTVTDTVAGLMWQQNEAPGTFFYTWEMALSYSRDLVVGVYDDWRLPNNKELWSLVDYGKYNPALDDAVFPDARQSMHWSSTTGAGGTDFAWVTNFQTGFSHPGDKGTYPDVRAVRGGQNEIPGHLIILAPVQGSSWEVGDPISITWDTAGLGGTVVISLSRQGGKAGTFETIAESTENDGSHTWTATGTASVNCVLRIEPLSDSSKGTSQGLFTISGESVPSVTTAAVSTITMTSAASGGNVTSDGGTSVTASGVCWSTSANPTISDNHTSDGAGTGSFISSMTGLSPGTAYLVRAYATNSAGTGYGNDVEFSSLGTSIISGTVYQSDGITPAATGVIVSLYTGNPCGSANYVTGAGTNSSGAYTLSGFPAGTYFLRTSNNGTIYLNEWWASGSSSLDCGDAESITVGVGETVTGKDFQLNSGAIISGTVYQSDGITPATGVIVSLYTGDPCGSASYVTGAGTNSSGAYSLSGFPAGTYYLRTSNNGTIYLNEWWASGLSSLDCIDADSITVGVGKTVTGRDFQLDSGSIISGTLYQSDGTTPATGVIVCLYTACTQVIRVASPPMLQGREQLPRGSTLSPVFPRERIPCEQRTTEPSI